MGYNITKCKRKNRKTGVSRVRANLTTLVTTPNQQEIEALKRSAISKLHRIGRIAEKAGLELNPRVLSEAKDRIKEMECREQYGDFVEDTEFCHGMLKEAVKSRTGNYYFRKSNG